MSCSGAEVGVGVGPSAAKRCATAQLPDLDRRRWLLRSGLGLGLYLVAGCQASTVAMDSVTTDSQGMVVTLEPAYQRSSIDDPMEIRWILRNTSATTQSLLIWNTPLESVLSADVFRITLDDKPVAYEGRQVKRVTPAPASALLSLDAGESVERILDLRNHYAVTEPGVYRIAYQSSPRAVEVEGVAVAPLVSTDDVSTDNNGIVVERY